MEYRNIVFEPDDNLQIFGREHVELHDATLLGRRRE